MEKILLTSSISCLKKYHEKLQYSYGQYLEDESNPFTRIIKDVILKGNTCWKELNVSSGLFTLIENQYVSGVGKPESELEIRNMYNFVVWYLSGQTAVEYILEWSPVVSCLPCDEIVYEKGFYSRVVYFQKSEATVMWEEINNYCYKKTYKVGENIHEIFKVNCDYNIEGTKIESFEWFPEMNWIQEVEKTALAFPSIVVKQTNPLIDSYKHLIHSIDRKLTASDKEMLKVVKSKVLVVGAKHLKENVQWDHEYWQWEIGADIKQIAEVNENLDKVLSFIQEEKRMLSWILSIPFSDIGLEDSWTGTGENAMIVKRAQFVQAMTTIRELFETCVAKLWIEEVIRWEDLNIDSEEVEVSNIVTARDSGLITNVAAVSRYNWVSEDEAKVIINEIQNETTNNNEQSVNQSNMEGATGTEQIN